MKLASLREGGRDGTLVVVDSTLRRCRRVPEIALTPQSAIDNWQQVAPALHATARTIENDNAANFEDFDPCACTSPLPRAYQFADASAYLNHVVLVRKARGAEMPTELWTDPLIYQGLSDGFLGPRESIPLIDPEWGLDFEAEIAVVLDDVPMGTDRRVAGNHVILFMLLNDVSLRTLVPSELSKGFGFFHSKPASAFSPVAVTPDELGDAWHDGAVHLPLTSTLNGELIGQPNAGVDMTFGFPELIAHAAKSRNLAAGTILGSGTVSNQDASAGASCLAEVRMREAISGGSPKTPFLVAGDRVRIEMLSRDGRSIFGAIEQEVVPVNGSVGQSIG